VFGRHSRDKKKIVDVQKRTNMLGKSHVFVIHTEKIMYGMAIGDIQ